MAILDRPWRSPLVPLVLVLLCRSVQAAGSFYVLFTQYPVQCSSVRRENSSSHEERASVSRATARRREEMSLESWTYGRASRGEGEIKKQKRYPEKRIAEPQLCDPGLTVLNICNTTAGEFGSENCSPFLQLSNLLFDLIAPRSQLSYESPLFFNDSEKHIKSSVRTRLALFIL